MHHGGLGKLTISNNWLHAVHAVHASVRLSFFGLLEQFILFVWLYSLFIISSLIMNMITGLIKNSYHTFLRKETKSFINAYFPFWLSVRNRDSASHLHGNGSASVTPAVWKTCFLLFVTFWDELLLLLCCVLVDLMRQLKLMLSVMSIDLLPYRRMVIKENPLL